MHCSQSRLAVAFVIPNKTGVDDMWIKKVLNSQFLHRLCLVFTLVGAITWILAWIAGENGRVCGFTQTRYYMDTICFLLVALGLRLGCLMHHWEERLGVRPNPYGYTVNPPIDKAQLPPLG